VTIQVTNEQLPEVVQRFDHCAMLTLQPDGSVKVHTVDVQAPRAGELKVACDHDSAHENLKRDPRVTLVWSPTAHHGWTLIADGQGEPGTDDLRIRVDSAMLHRPNAHDDGPEWVF
jgi:hypothetical protein